MYTFSERLKKLNVTLFKLNNPDGDCEGGECWETRVSTIRELGARHTGRSCSDRATSTRWEIFDSEGFFLRSFGSPRWPRWLGSLVLEFFIFVDDRYPQGHEQAITPAGAIRLLFLGRPKLSCAYVSPSLAQRR